MHPDPRTLRQKAETNTVTRRHAWLRRGIAKRQYEQTTGQDWDALYLRALLAREVVRESQVLGHTGPSSFEWEERAAAAVIALYAALACTGMPKDRIRSLDEWEQALDEDGGQPDGR